MAHDAVQAKRRATYEDLLQVPDTMVAEIVDGELVVSPRPATPHAFTAAGIAAHLLPAFHGREAIAGPGGWWILPEPELHFADDVVVPDLAAWRCARMTTVPNASAITLAPDWLCEILSPSSVRHDRIAKMRCYAREGVGWVWLVDPVARTLEILHGDGGQWTVVASHAADEVIRAEPFAEVEMQLRRWWLAD
jgi:Uma2 family endonuclease